RLCLFGDHALDLRTPLRAGAAGEELAALMRSAMLIKPARHHLKLGETSSRMRAFSEVGGQWARRIMGSVTGGRGRPLLFSGGGRVSTSTRTGLDDYVAAGPTAI